MAKEWVSDSISRTRATNVCVCSKRLERWRVSMSRFFWQPQLKLDSLERLAIFWPNHRASHYSMLCMAHLIFLLDSIGFSNRIHVIGGSFFSIWEISARQPIFSSHNDSIGSPNQTLKKHDVLTTHELTQPPSLCKIRWTDTKMEPADIPWH